MKDSRVSELLSMTGLESRIWDSCQPPVAISLNVNFNQAMDIIEIKRNSCIEWLRKELMNMFE